jgi:release factor glutamine methyltransferase
MIQKQWTVVELIRWGSEYFGDKGVDSPRLTMELLLADVMKLSRVQLYMNFDKPLMPEELSHLRTLVKRRARREPLQYILGTTSFYGLELEVTPAVLIPRPETEELVDEVLRYVRLHRFSYQYEQEGAGLRIMDVGTGSGCIALALASALPNSYVIAVDVSAEALMVARRNAERLKVGNIHFVCADMLCTSIEEVARLECAFQATQEELQGIIDKPPLQNDCCVVDILVSNPPYISADQMASLQPEVGLFEPRQALTDGGDGLAFYRQLARWSSSVRLLTAVEMGFGQRNDVERLFAEHGCTTTVKNDMAGVPRMLFASSQHSTDTMHSAA